MSNSDNVLKSIGELEGMEFHIPHYQRGYRWGEKEVKALLEDIEDFMNTIKIRIKKIKSFIVFSLCLSDRQRKSNLM